MPLIGKKNKQPEPAQQGAGLKMAAHPLLLDTAPSAPQSKKDRYKPMQPKFASIKVMVTPSRHAVLMIRSGEYTQRTDATTCPDAYADAGGDQGQPVRVELFF
jgi:hypothetical protein